MLRIHPLIPLGVVIILIGIVLFVQTTGVSKRTYLDSPQFSLGNHLCFYYNELVKDVLSKRDFVDFLRNAQTNDLFLRYLPPKISYIKDLKPLFEELSNHGITQAWVRALPINIWETPDRQVEVIHEVMRPFMNRLLSRALERSGLQSTIDHPVVHFRCADTPFIRHPSYHLQRLCFFTNALRDAEEALGVHYSEVTILSYTHHHETTDLALQGEQACGAYVDSVASALSEAGYKVSITSGGLLEDFTTIFYAPVLISTSSSFSFIGCYFGEGWCASASRGRLADGREHCEDCSDRMYLGLNLDHADVVDYFDTETVVAQLKNCSKDGPY